MEVKKTPPSADLNRAYPPPASQLLQLVPDKTAGSLFAEKYPERELRSPSSHIPYGVGGGGVTAGKEEQRGDLELSGHIPLAQRSEQFSQAVAFQQA